ncbi:MAG TPA: sulfite exporter TauE/SafE family protein, partial [Streptosporangiaceae bacterium]
GGLAGAIALLSLPPSAFRLIVPVLILISCALVLVQPRLAAWVSARRDGEPRGAGPVLSAGMFLAGAYGGYFGAAQGVLVIGLLGTFLDETLQRVNGAKNVLVAIVNGTAALVFILFAHVAWVAVALVAAGSTVGGLAGARFGRRLPPIALRLFVVIIGVISAAKLIFF